MILQQCNQQFPEDIQAIVAGFVSSLEAMSTMAPSPLDQSPRLSNHPLRNQEHLDSVSCISCRTMLQEYMAVILLTRTSSLIRE